VEHLINEGRLPGKVHEKAPEGANGPLWWEDFVFTLKKAVAS
jgi:hypothetical protein